MECGVVYIGLGEERRSLLASSLRATRLRAPALPVYAIADAPVDAPFSWAAGHRPDGEIWFKTRLPAFSPHGLTVFVDAGLAVDTAVAGHACRWAEEMLDGYDLAVALEPRPSAAGAPPDLSQRWGMTGEVELAAMRDLSVRHPEMPCFDTRLLLFRRGPRVGEFFDAWHAEWLRFGGAERPAFARAVARAGPKLRLLGPASDFADAPSEPSSAVDAGGGVREAFEHAVANGMCSPNQYAAIGRAMLALRPLNLLVFGCGADSRLWHALNRGGRTTFVESDRRFVSWAAQWDLEVVPFAYPTRRGEPADDTAKRPPGFLADTAWDMVFIDGPAGHSAECPGRELPIHWAAAMPSRPLVALHDAGRPWERACAQTYLGPADHWVEGQAPEFQELAFWLRGRVRPPTLWGELLPR